jgi:hypothetical protein
MERKHNFEFVGRSHHVIFVRDLQRHRFLHHVPTFKDFSTIKYQNDGVFYTYITLGGVEGKQQTFSAILDTGSRTIAIPCKNCNDRCGSEHNQYDISLSPTAKIVDEHGYSQCYAEGSCNRGQLMMDNICFGQACPVIESAQISFGCCNEYSRLFKMQLADGIIGIGPGSNLIKHLHDVHKLETYVFAICVDKDNGRFSVGGYAEKLHEGEIQWTTLSSNFGHYTNFVQSIEVVGGKTAIFEEGDQDTLIDSGTTYTYLPGSKFEKLKTIFETACKENGKCNGATEPNPNYSKEKSLGCYVNLSSDMKKTFPTLTFNFVQGVEYKVTPDMYFFRATKNVTCIGVFDDGDKFNMITLGANLMDGHDIIFDIEENRLGIVKSNCESLPQHVAHKNINNNGDGMKNKWLMYFIVIGVILLFVCIIITLCYKGKKYIARLKKNVFSYPGESEFGIIFDHAAVVTTEYVELNGSEMSC